MYVKQIVSSDSLTFKEFEMLLFTEDVAAQFLSGPRWPASVPELSGALGAELDRGPVHGDRTSQQWRMIEQVLTSNKDNRNSQYLKAVFLFDLVLFFIWN